MRAYQELQQGMMQRVSVAFRRWCSARHCSFQILQQREAESVAVLGIELVA